MKDIRTSEHITIKCDTGKDPEWKLFHMLLIDLGLSKPGINDLVNHDVPDLSGLDISRRLRDACRRRDWQSLMALKTELEPRCILGLVRDVEDKISSFYALYQAGAFLRKFPAKGKDSKYEAIAGFHKNERTCYLFNRENYRSLITMNESHPDFLGIIEEVKNDIEILIGDAPDFERICVDAQHGPGIAYSDRYRNGCCTSYFKWGTVPYTVTKRALPYAKVAIESDPRWIGALDNLYRIRSGIGFYSPLSLEKFWDFVFEVVEGNRITTVPKTVETDRTIAIEPLLNVYLQLGVDQQIRRRMKTRWGYDLDDQTKNQRLARKGSIDGDLSTVDLSAASDLISLRICAMLLPPLWFDLLYQLRSPCGIIDGVSISYEKISSMGNGYTFALESLIFGAITRAAIRRTRSVHISAVYGDDIVLPSTAFKYLVDLLELSGFRVNLGKTFNTGHFRESCGVDVLCGHNVRPVFLKERLNTLPKLFYIHNILVEQKNLFEWPFGFTFSNSTRIISRWIPTGVRDMYYGPVTDSLDTHLFSNRMCKKDKKSGMRFYRKIVPRPLTFNRRSDFFFRKLMVKLLPSPARSRWDKKSLSNSGNAFDITKRGAVKHICARCMLY